MFISKEMREDHLFVEFIEEYLSKNNVDRFLVSYCSKEEATAPPKSAMVSQGTFADGRLYRLDWSSPSSIGDKGMWIMRIEQPTPSQLIRKAWQF